MRRMIVVLTVVAVVAGVAVVTVLGAPSVAVAQEEEDAPETTEDAPSSDTLDEVLSDLVDDGVLTEEQADAVKEAITTRVGCHRGFRLSGHANFDVVAAVIGVETDELTDALRDGDTIAEVATANDVDPQSVIEALVAEFEARIDEALADERIDEDRAAELREGAADSVEALVNGDYSSGRGFGFGRRGHGFGGFGLRGGFGFRGGNDSSSDA